MIQCIKLVTLVAAAAAVRPDISFSDDKYDLGNLIDIQNKYFDDLARSAVRDGAVGGRRISDFNIDQDPTNRATWHQPYHVRPMNFRRNAKNKKKHDETVKKDAADKKYVRNLVKFLKKVRRAGSEMNIPIDQFSFHETEQVDHGEHDSSYEKNLDLLRTREGEEYRRRLQKYVNNLHGLHQKDLVADFRRTDASAPYPVEEIFLHQAFPIKVKISGYLREPSDNEVDKKIKRN